MARRLTPAEYATKLVNNAANSTQAYKDGVSSVTEAPTARAAKMLDKAKANYIASIDSGRMKKKLEDVSLDEWKTLTMKKGGDHYASGISDSKPKIEIFASKLLPYVYALSDKIKAMPSTTKQHMKDRMLANFDGMSAFTS